MRHLWPPARQAFLQRKAANPSPFPTGLGDHPEDLCIHQPHSAPRSPGALACRAGGEVASSTFANHLWDKSEAFRCKLFWEIHTPFKNEVILKCWDVDSGYRVPSYQTQGPDIFQSLIHQKCSSLGGALLKTPFWNTKVEREHLPTVNPPLSGSEVLYLHTKDLAWEVKWCHLNVTLNLSDQQGLSSFG